MPVGKVETMRQKLFDNTARRTRAWRIRDHKGVDIH